MGVDKKASQEEIKRSYRKLARKYHPDVSKEASAEAKFKELGEAYEILKNPKKRAEYDELAAYWKQQSQRQNQGQYQSQPKSETFSAEHEQKFEDFINSIFGQNSASYSSGFDKGQDIHARVQITLEDSFYGQEKTLQLNNPQLNAHGQQIEQLKTIKIKIPKGVTDQQQIRLKGQGMSAANGLSGDLYLEIHILPHSKFTLDRKDIHIHIELYPWEAALGGEKIVPTLGGSVKVKVPKLNQSTQQLRLKERGLPGSPSGDQYIHFTLKLPEGISPKAKELYQQLAAEYQAQTSAQRSE